MTDISIKRLGHLGDGVAEGPIYAPLTLPGEVVRGVVDGDHLTDVKIVTPSEHRVSAPCPQFRRCGGCNLQHASDAFLAEWKTTLVRDALAAHGLEAEIFLGSTSPAQSRRRATFAARRTKKGALVGFHKRGSDEIVEIPDCQLLHPKLMAALPLIEATTIAGASRKHALDVFVTTTQSGLDIAVSGGKPADAPLIEALGALSRNNDVARLVWDGDVVVLRNPPEQSFDSVVVTPPPGAFLQPTEAGEGALRQAVEHIVQDSAPVADLFAGCGTFALPLAKRTPVHAVEGDKAMLAALDAGWRHNQGLRPVTTEMRDLFRNPLLPEELNRFGAVVLDPPRAGASAQVAQCAESTVPVIAYVSCHPGSFARDAAVLVGAGYEMGKVTVVDQFRWSPHTELVCAFKRRF